MKHDRATVSVTGVTSYILGGCVVRRNTAQLLNVQVLRCFAPQVQNSSQSDQRRSKTNLDYICVSDGSHSLVDGFRPDSGSSRGDHCRHAFRPIGAASAVVCYVRNTSTPAGRNAQIPVIHRRLGERVKSGPRTALRRPRQRRHPAANAIAPSLARANGATPLRSRF
jgi:hypothetical protein